jgi:DNA-binding Lrp family transcriptional regulator
MDAVDARIVDTLQQAFPICERPFLAVADRLAISEGELIERVDRLLCDGTLTRFGPLFNADRLGGAFVLCAMAVPEERFDDVAAVVSGMREVAHNYAREHALNLWFVLATETRAKVDDAIAAIERATKLRVLAFPKEREYFVDLRLPAQQALR